MTAPSVRRSRLCTGLAVAAYLVVALVTFRVVLPAPATLLPYPALLDKSSLPNWHLASIDHWDEQMVVATVIRNAHLLVHRPWALFDEYRGYVACEFRMRMADPGDGSVHESSCFSILHYAGNGLWSYEEDKYDPAELEAMIAGWVAAKARCDAAA